MKRKYELLDCLPALAVSAALSWLPVGLEADAALSQQGKAHG